MFTLKPNITPIWTLNEMAGKHATVLWTGGEFDYRELKYRDLVPAQALPVGTEIPWKQYIDDFLIPLLQQKECTVNLAMYYVKNPKFVSRAFSPQSKEVSPCTK